MNQKPECSACAYWVEVDPNPLARGECRRFPPQVFPDAQVEGNPKSAFPWVQPYHWCGEFKRKGQRNG